jgi:hypothetical protein
VGAEGIGLIQMGSFGEMMDRFNRHHHLTKELIHDPSYANPSPVDNHF